MRSSWIGRPPDVLVAGDSLTAGEHASDRRRAYAPLLLGSLPETLGRRVRTRVAGLSGARVADLLRRDLPAASHLVVVEVGTNDWQGYSASGPWKATPVERFDEEYGLLLDRLMAGHPTLVCLGVWGPSGGLSQVGARLNDYDDVIAAACAARRGAFVSLSPVYDDPGSRGPGGRPTPFGASDEEHPNDRGHARIAQLVSAASTGSGEAVTPSPQS